MKTAMTMGAMAAGLALAAPAAADFPSEVHVDELRGCLANMDNPELCIGMVSDPCFKAVDHMEPATCIAGERWAWYEIIRDVFAEIEADLARADAAEGDNRRVSKLHAAQSAWVEHRNADCAMRAAMDGEDEEVVNTWGEEAVNASCTMRHTAERAIELKALRDD